MKKVNGSLVELLRQISGDTCVEEVPPDWKTKADLAAQIGRGESQTGVYLRTLLKSGKVERRLFRIQVGSRPYPVPHFRLKK